MKTNRSNRLLSLLASSALLAISSAQAQLYWDGNTTTAGAGNTTALLNRTWGTFAAWNTDATGGGAGAFQTATLNTDDLYLVAGPSATSGNFNYVVTVDAAQVANSLNFRAQGTTTISGGTSITLGNGTADSGGITMNQFAYGSTAQGAVSITTTPIILNNAQNWTNNAVASLSVKGGVDLNGNRLTFNGTGLVSLENTASVITGAGGLTVSSGRVVLGGGGTAYAHTYSGDTNINGGVLMFNGTTGNLSVNSNIDINGGVLETYWTGGLTRVQGSGANEIRITGGESGFSMNGNNGATFNIGAITWGSATFNPTKFVLQAASAQGSSNLALSGAINLNGATRTVVVSGGTTGAARASITGAISNSTGTAGFIKEGAGTLLLSNNSSAWNDTTTVSAGLLSMGGINLANIGGGSGRNITVANGAGIHFNTLSNAVLNRIVETTSEIGVMTGTTSNNLDFSSSTGADLSKAFLGNYATNGAKMEYSGILTPASDNYRLGAKYSSGLLGIVGTNKITGTQGLLVGGTGASGIRVNLAGANDFTGDTVINTGAKLTIGNPLALQNSTLNVGAAGGTFALAAGTNAGRITGETAAPNPTFGGLSGSRNLVAVFTNSAGNNETNLAVTAVTGFTLNVATGKDLTYSGAIGGFGTGAVGVNGGISTLAKSGLGKQTLSGVSTYTGATTVTAGTLALGSAGTIANSTSLTINAGATFDTTAKTTYTIPAAQPVEFGIDATAAGSAGKIAATELDISNATVTYDITGTPDDPVYVLATYTPGQLTGTFLSAPAAPSGYTLDYAYEGNKIALVSTGGGDVTPPTLTSITDNVSGGPVNIGAAVTYTVTFDEDMNDATVTTADFGNNGTAVATIDSVTETTPGVFSVVVTPTSPGTLVLRINALAVLEDVAGNDLDTDPALLDDTTITVRNAYQTWALTNAISSAPGQDKDGDGVNNAIEFLLGGDVATNDLSKLPEVTTTATDMIFTFERKRSSIDGITGCEVEVGTALTGWPTSYTVGTTTGTSDAGVVVTENSPVGFDTITLTVPKGSDPKKFARLNVTVTE